LWLVLAALLVGGTLTASYLGVLICLPVCFANKVDRSWTLDGLLLGEQDAETTGATLP